MCDVPARSPHQVVRVTFTPPLHDEHHQNNLKKHTLAMHDKLDRHNIGLDALTSYPYSIRGPHALQRPLHSLQLVCVITFSQSSHRTWQGGRMPFVGSVAAVVLTVTLGGTLPHKPGFPGLAMIL